MNELMIKYERAIEKLSLRMRIVVLAVAAAVALVLWYSLFWSRTTANSAILKQSVATTNKSVVNLQLQLTNLQKVQNDLEKQLATQLTNGNKAKMTAAESLEKTNVSPNEMARVLQDLLTTRQGLTLMQLETLPVRENLTLGAPTKLFEYGISIKFQGDFFSTMEYLQSIEKLHWLIFWDKLDYKVTNYPLAEINIQLHTVSDREDWLNV
jgi:MSHA biogenesis protein MshJ